MRNMMWQQGPEVMVYLALLKASGLHIDGREEILEKGSGQLQMLLTTKAVHHNQRSILQQ